MDEINAITMLLATTLLNGALNIASNTGTMMNAPPAPTIPESIPIASAVINSEILLKCGHSFSVFTLTNIKNTATIAKNV